ncbi:MAG: HAD family hydrolase [Candidatus Sungbacteria bacterium]|nr:HAD family hydrolase [Candidatus Sungbacteria bacterium]
MILILDFDGVLFDGEKFKQDYLRIFSDAGIASDDVRMAYRAGRTHPKGYHHVLTARVAPHINAKELARRTQALLDKSPRYLYPDARQFLQWCRRTGITLAIVSRGPAFQKKKITASGIARSFKKITVIPMGPKSEAVHAIMRAHPRHHATFVDDTAEVVDEVKRSLPTLTAVQMTRRRRIEKSAVADARVADFAGVMRVIRKTLRS